MNRMDRLLGIVTLLQSKKYVPAEKIADKYNISVRTVYRDVKALVELGIPVSFEPNRGYFVVQGYFLPPVAFSSEEANALLKLAIEVNNNGIAIDNCAQRLITHRILRGGKDAGPDKGPHQH